MKYNYTREKNNYMTPPELLEKALVTKQRDLFDLDVCCTTENVPAVHHYKNGEVDGLAEPWKKLNWCNPPFEECAKWIKKAFLEQQEGKETVMLIPVRTETKYWHEFILNNPKVKIEWLRKGYSFINPEDNKPMGVFKNALALVYFNKE